MTRRNSSRPALTRRQALGLGAGLLAAPFVLRPALAQTAAWRNLEEVRAFIGDGFPVASGVTLDLPFVSEDGSSVALGVVVNRPMTALDHVTELSVFAPGNPAPEVANYLFTPQSGRAQIATRIRLNQSQTVVAIARTSTGALHYGEREVRVTVSGCIGRADTYASTDIMLGRARGPDRFAPGTPGEITTLINHPQETGLRTGNDGRLLPMNIVTGLTARLAGVTLFEARYHRSVAANPYLRFFVAPPAAGDLVVAWTEDTGRSAEAIVPVRF